MLLTRDAKYREEHSYRLRYITDYSDEALAALNDQHSRPPTEAFSSPFVGMEIRQINDIFLEKFSGQHGFADWVFFVMDSLSAEDETLVVVEARDPARMTEEDDGIATLRTDFYAARQAATLSDIHLEKLLDNRDYMRIYERCDFQMDL